MQFQGFTLDDFQEQAIASINKGNSVVVSAATGTGKTLIADYVIDQSLKSTKRIVYTAPIKALSNQKYRDFCARYGKESIGIITGDVQINTRAQILIMTTEIYRNMLISRDDLIGTISHVIFDEIHFISDLERGTIWEESLIFSPKFVRFVCLSATIPNARQFADWIGSIKDHPVDVIKYDKRAVPLTHLVADIEYGFLPLTELAKKMHKDRNIPRYGGNIYRRKEQELSRPTTEHVVTELKRRDWLPCLYFIFSRAECEKQAHFLSKSFNFLDGSQKARVQERFRQTIPEEQRGLESVRVIREWASKGIGVHHAGLLPSIKEAIELLFADGLLKVLFTTETFAVGLNLPARAVVFHSLEKFDGMNFRYLNSKEYFQLAGRAGRRGIDKEGFAIGVIDRRHADIERISRFTSADTEPIISQFQMSYNTALHLVTQHTPEEVEIILKSNFDFYLRKSEKGHVRVMAAYNNRLKKLRQLGYLNQDDSVTQRGQFLLNIYSYELLVGEIFSTKLWQSLTDAQLALLAASIVYEERRNDKTSMRGTEHIVTPIIRALESNDMVMKELNRQALRKLANIITHWCAGCAFEELLRMTDSAEGDIIHLFRRALDLMRQVRHATLDETLRERLGKAMALLDRDVVQVNL
jgi:superfamily II RNA helicase